MKLTEQERDELKRRQIQLEQEREAKIAQQLAALKALIETHQNAPQTLHNAINDNLKSYKPDALELAYQYMRENDYPEESTRAVGKLFHTRMIGGVKVDRALTHIGDKQEGATPGARVKKDNPNTLKGDKTILLKKGGDHSGLEGEEVCEYYGSSLAMAMMGSKLSPKFRLHKLNSEQLVASTFIKGFKTFQDGASGSDAKGFGKFLAREFIIGNYDVHSANAGITTINGEKYWTGIDDGRAISYNADRQWQANNLIHINQPQNLQNFVSRMQEIKPNTLYPSNLFTGAEFACDLNAAVKDIDIEIMRHILKESTKNLKQLYGNNFLSTPNISNELCKRMNLTPLLTEQIIEDKIIENIISRKQQLQEMASREAEKVLNQAINRNDTNTIKYMALHMPESIKAYVTKHPNLANSERINTTLQQCIEENLDNKKVLKDLYKHFPEVIDHFITSKLKSTILDRLSSDNSRKINLLKNLYSCIPEAVLDNKAARKELNGNAPIFADAFITTSLDNQKALNRLYTHFPERVNTFIESNLGNKVTLEKLNTHIPNAIGNFIQNNLDNTETLEAIYRHFPEAIDNFIKDNLNNKKALERLRTHIPNAIGNFIQNNLDNKETLEEIYRHFPEAIDNFIKDNLNNKKELEKLHTHLPTVINDFVHTNLKNPDITIAAGFHMQGLIKAGDVEALKTFTNAIQAPKIDEMSPLKYAISIGKIDPAIKMVKEGFTIREDEVDNDKSVTIKNSNYFWSKSGTKNDEIRKAIIGNNSNISDDILKTKPSLLYLAMETGQKNLAIELVDKGYKLKSSELKIYTAQNQAHSIKLSLMGQYLGWYNEEDKIQIKTSIESRAQKQKGSHAANPMQEVDLSGENRSPNNIQSQSERIPNNKGANRFVNALKNQGSPPMQEVDLSGENSRQNKKTWRGRGRNQSGSQEIR